MDSDHSNLKFDPVRILSQAFTYVKHLRLMLILFTIALLAGISYFLYATPVFQARSLVFFQSFGNPLRNAELPETSVFSAGVNRALIERLQSQQLLIEAAEKLGLLKDDVTYEALLEHIPLVRVDIVDARHLEITVMAYDPEVVRTFAPAMVEAFQEIQEAGWKEFRDEALERYQVQLTELEEKVAENVDSLTSMERDQKFTEVTIEQQSLLEIPKQLVETRERLKRMDSVRTTLERYESEPESAENTLSILSLLSNFEKDTIVEVGNLVQRSLAPNRSGVVGGKPSEVQVVTPADVEGVEPWRELEREKRSIESQIQESSTLLLPDHPKMKELAGQLETIERSLQSEMRVLREKFDIEYLRLTEKLAELQRRIPEYQKITEEFGRSSLQYSSIEQTQLMWDTARVKLAEKLAAATFTEDFDSVQLSFKGHTSLRDKNPISPNKRKLVMLSLLIGLGGAIGVPTILNLLDTSATSLAQLEDYIGLKGIGIVPLTDPDFLESVHRSPAQGAAVPNYLLECFRVIRANIGLDAKFDGLESQVILITSARPQEGKTTQAANLAWAYHSMGEKVLLVDCDLRRGRQHVLLKLDNGAGMSRMLIGQISPEEAIMHTEQEGFDAIPRGPIIAGSTELLCQDGFFSLMQHWRTRYDRIIVDCPPVLGLSESTSLQRLADGIVLVVRSEKTSMKDVRDAVTVLKKTGAHFFGFVLNGVDLSKVGNYYQYYYYSAPYYDQFDGDPEEVAAAKAKLKAARQAPPEAPSKAEARPLAATPPPLLPPDDAAPVREIPRAPESRPRTAANPGMASTAARQAPPQRPVKTAPAPAAASSPAPAAWAESEADQSWQRAQEAKQLEQMESEWQKPIERRPNRPRRPPGDSPT